MDENNATAEWRTLFEHVLENTTLNAGSKPGSTEWHALTCKVSALETLADMYTDLGIQVPSDMLRHRITAEARCANRALDELNLDPKFRISTAWPRLVRDLEVRL